MYWIALPLPEWTYWSLRLQFDCIWRWSLEGGVKLKPGHKGGALIHWDWCPFKKKRHQRTLTHSLSLCVHSEERLGEDTMRRWLSASQEERFHQKPTLATWTSSLQRCETINVCCSSTPVCTILLWQPRETDTGGFSPVLGNMGTEVCLFVTGMGVIILKSNLAVFS